MSKIAITRPNPVTIHYVNNDCYHTMLLYSRVRKEKTYNTNKNCLICCRFASLKYI